MTYTNVFDALADTPALAENLRLRAEFMRELQSIVRGTGWTQSEAARQCGISQPRMNDLLRGRLSKFSLDALVNVAAHLRRRVHLEIEKPDPALA